MQPAPAPKRRAVTYRMVGWLFTRRFWLVVGVAVVSVLAVYWLVAVPVGPTPFAFTLTTSACGCQHTESVYYTLPDRAFVSLSFTSHYLGNVSEYVLIVTSPSGAQVVYAGMNGGMFGSVNVASTTATFTTSGGGAFEFTLLGAYPTDLPAISAWFNGTYHAPTLS